VTNGSDPFTALEIGGDYDGLTLRDVDLSGQVGSQSRFLDCRFERCRLDEVQLRRARFGDTALADSASVALDVADSSWRDCVVSGGRYGALTAHGASLARVRFAGCRVDYVNLRGANLVDVTFEDCRIGEVDCGHAELTRVGFDRCQIDELGVSGAVLAEVDLSRAALAQVSGLAHLAGAMINESQLADLAPSFAAQLGIRVVPL
jgi:uncharacterized protein YjbI with pentapeptide repeats